MGKIGIARKRVTLHEYREMPSRLPGKFHVACTCGWRGMMRNIGGAGDPVGEWRTHQRSVGIEIWPGVTGRRDHRGHPIYRIKAGSAPISTLVRCVLLALAGCAKIPPPLPYASTGLVYGHRMAGEVLDGDMRSELPPMASDAMAESER